MSVSDTAKDYYPTPGDLRDCLRKHGITHGIREDALKQMANFRTCRERVLVAVGTQPQAGEPGSLELMVDTSTRGKPLVGADGRVDLRNLQLVINVAQGQKLVRRIEPESGVPGIDIFGQQIEPPSPTPIHFKMGSGTEISNDDQNVLVASIDGAVVVGHDGTVEVVESEIIPNDIDYNTGNVNFKGDITIRGSVRAGFSVAAEGHLHIGGNVEDAKVCCTGNLVIAGGAVGSGQGSLECGGSLTVRHVEHFNVKAGRNADFTEDVIHSNIVAQGQICAKSIVGGTIIAGESIVAESVGAAAETRTTLDVGGAFLLNEEKQGLLQDIEMLNQELFGCRKAQYNLVHDAMDENGTLKHEDEQVLEELWSQRIELEQRRAGIREHVDEINHRLERRGPALVKVGKVLPNTLVRFGHVGKLVKSTLLKVAFTLEDQRIKIAKF